MVREWLSIQARYLGARWTLPLEDLQMALADGGGSTQMDAELMDALGSMT